MDERREFYTYVGFRPWNAEPCYVGKGIGDRMDRHEWFGDSHYNKHLARIIKKAGGSIPIVKTREGLTESEAFETEIALIKAIGRGKNGPLVNLTDGGDGASGYRFTQEQRAHLSKKAKARYENLEEREKQSAFMKKRFEDPAEREKLSLSLMGHAVSAKTRASLREIFLGRETPQDVRAKMSAAHKGQIPSNLEQLRVCNIGRPCSETKKAKIRAAKTGQKHTDAARALISASAKGRIVPLEGRYARSKTLMGHAVSEKTRALIGAAVRKRSAEKRAKALELNGT